MKTLALGMAVALMTGCGKPAPKPALIEVGASAPLSAALERAVAEYAQSSERCQTEVERVLTKPALPGTPELERVRAPLLARAKAEPVMFWRAPEAAPNPSLEAQILRQELAQAVPVGRALAHVARLSENRPELAREVLLREGYLYADQPELAVALVDGVELAELFDAPELSIQRGRDVLRVVRSVEGKYEYQTGPEAGKRARLLLFDRLSEAGSAFGPPLHFELRGLAERLHFERMRVVRLTRGEIVAELRYGDLWIPTLLRSHDAELERVCEIVPKESRERVADARERTRRRGEVHRIKQRAMREQVEESLPFDEPRTEEGQQDGNLRPAWIWAYTHGWDSYKFNDDRYPVFDTAGRPRVPQVCVDFITDTLERASGTHWRERGAQRERVKGQLDFNDLGVGNRRSVDRFVEFAEAHPQWFDVYRMLPEERVPFGQRERFFAHLSEHADRYIQGDIVVIHGFRDDNEMHYHSFFVYESDPLTGMPTLVAANAGRPRIRSWESEMRNAPRRSIRMRVRPRLEWLESVFPTARSLSSSGPGALPASLGKTG